MYKLGLRVYISAAHYLRDYPGKCSSLHGHRWVVEAIIKVETLNSLGMGHDFRKFRKQLQKITDALDHQCLNKVSPFDKINPTAENMARVIFERFRDALPKRLKLHEVKVWESSDAWASYSPEGEEDA